MDMAKMIGDFIWRWMFLLPFAVMLIAMFVVASPAMLILILLSERCTVAEGPCI